MSAPILNAFSVFIILAIGYILKKTDVLTKETSRRFSFVIMYITLPCAILSSTSGISFEPSLLGIMLISVAFNLSLCLMPLLKLKEGSYRAFVMTNLAGFNIGNFVLPFMAGMVGPRAFLAMAMFDLINAVFIFGGSYSLALWFNRGAANGQTVSPKDILKELSKSVPTYAYLIAIACAAISVKLPPEILTPITTIGKANTFLCMLIIGSALNFSVGAAELRQIATILAVRYGWCVLLGAVLLFVLPFDNEIKLMLAVLALAPIGSMNSVMTLRKLPDYTGTSSDLVSVSLLISLVLVTVITAAIPFSSL